MKNETALEIYAFISSNVERDAQAANDTISYAVTVHFNGVLEGILLKQQYPTIADELYSAMTAITSEARSTTQSDELDARRRGLVTQIKRIVEELDG